ncbi:MAG: hypothetical protein AAF619_05875 [Pseudomonadota bacterium]
MADIMNYLGDLLDKISSNWGNLAIVSAAISAILIIFLNVEKIMNYRLINKKIKKELLVENKVNINKELSQHKIEISEVANYDIEKNRV